MNKKSLWITIVACIAVAAVSIGATMAWLTDKDSVKNAVSIGNVQIEVNDDEKDGPISPQAIEKDEVTGDYINTDSWYKKAPTVVSVGENPCIVRARIVLNPITGSAKDKDRHSTFMAWVNDNREELLVIGGFDTDKWVLDGDYFYYLGVLDNKTASHSLPTETSPLFTNFALTSNYLEIAGESFDFYLYAEAVQAEHLLVAAGNSETFATNLAAFDQLIKADKLTQMKAAFAELGNNIAPYTPTNP